MGRIDIVHLGVQAYDACHRAMQARIESLRNGQVAELWLVQHPPVFTQGQAGKAEHVLAPGDIPVVQSDRGGQVTYHGPGQIVLYTLIPLKAFGLNVRALVRLLEQAVIEVLASLGIDATARVDAPGVYVGGAKIASLGLRIRHGVSYHGVAVNVQMDLTPFDRINPCGYAGMPVTQVATEAGFDQDPVAFGKEVAARLQSMLAAHGVAGQAQ